MYPNEPNGVYEKASLDFGYCCWLDLLDVLLDVVILPESAEYLELGYFDCLCLGLANSLESVPAVTLYCTKVMA